MLIASAVGLTLSGLAVATRVCIQSNSCAETCTARAHAGIKYALWYSAVESNWRTTVSGPQDVPWAWADGKVTVEFIDEDGDLTDDSDDQVELVSRATFDDVQRGLRAVAEPVPLRALNMAIHAGGMVTIDGTLTVTAPVSSNQHILVNSSGTLDGDAEAAGSVISTGTITGTATSGVPTKQLPDSDFALYHMADATAISIYSIPGYIIEEVVLSPANNPYGAPNPEGIYRIQCYGEQLIIRNCRIVGTLILDTCGAASRVRGGIVWEPANAKRPALIVWSNEQVNLSFTGPLDENEWVANFNPCHTPYDGQCDDDNDDVYTSEIKGLIYSAGPLLLRGSTSIVGVVLSDQGVTTEGTIKITHDPQLANDPPAGGLRGPALRLLRGTYRRDFGEGIEVDPIPPP